MGGRSTTSLTKHRYRHQLNHTPKQIYNCDFPDCSRTFVRQDLCNRHRDRHTAKGSQLHRKDSLLGHAHASSPIATTELGRPLSTHGPNSPDVMRPNLGGLKSRTSQLQYQSPQEQTPASYSPVTNPSSGTYSNGASSNGPNNFHGVDFKHSNNDNIPGHDSPNPTPGSRSQRHPSFGVSDSKPADFTRPSSMQTNVGPYGLMSSNSGNNYHNSQPSPQPYVSQQNFAPFTLPPPGFSTTSTTITPAREPEPSYPTSMSTEYPLEATHHAQSGSDMMLLDQMAVPNTMPVFGGEGYNRSPFAIPEDFVAYLFSNQQMDNNASPMGQMGQQGYAQPMRATC